MLKLKKNFIYGNKQKIILKTFSESVFLVFTFIIIIITYSLAGIIV